MQQLNQSGRLCCVIPGHCSLSLRCVLLPRLVYAHVMCMLQCPQLISACGYHFEHVMNTKTMFLNWLEATNNDSEQRPARMTDNRYQRQAMCVQPN
jgi:hypothetical protein